MLTKCSFKPCDDDDDDDGDEEDSGSNKMYSFWFIATNVRIARLWKEKSVWFIVFNIYIIYYPKYFNAGYFCAFGRVGQRALGWQNVKRKPQEHVKQL